MPSGSTLAATVPSGEEDLDSCGKLAGWAAGSSEAAGACQRGLSERHPGGFLYPSARLMEGRMGGNRARLGGPAQFTVTSRPASTGGWEFAEGREGDGLRSMKRLWRGTGGRHGHRDWRYAPTPTLLVQKRRPCLPAAFPPVCDEPRDPSPSLKWAFPYLRANCKTRSH